MQTNHNDFERSPEAAAYFSERVRVNQHKLTAELKPRYDCIVCGSGSSGSVVARRLAENPDVSVLLIEAGGSDDVPSVMEANRLHQNRRTADPTCALLLVAAGRGAFYAAAVWRHAVEDRGAATHKRSERPI